MLKNEPKRLSKTRVFWAGGTTAAGRKVQLEKVLAAYPDDFHSTAEVGSFLERIEMPATGRWALASNPKAGCTSLKKVLFEIEFGTPLTARFSSPSDINSNAASQRISRAGLLLSLRDMRDPLAKIENTVRITTSRHPASRAVSMFNYICKANDEAKQMFIDDRIRLNALLRFDWDIDPYTAKGFYKFLRYVKVAYKQAPLEKINYHFRRQVDVVRPEIFKPTLVGSVENSAAFYAELSELFDCKLPAKENARAENRNETSVPLADLMTSDAQKLIEEIYEADFEWLGLAADEWKRK